MSTGLARWFRAATSEPSPTATVDPKGARSAAHQAQVELERERTRSRQTTEISESLRELRERNHFADLIYASMEMKAPVHE